MSDGAKKASSGFHIVAGLGSGALSAIILQPADLLKTRIQQQPHASQSLTRALKEITTGPNPVRTLWRGATPSMIRTGFGSALYFGMLNQMRTYASRLPTGSNSPLGTSLTTRPSSSALPKLGNVANLTTGAAARVAAGLIVNPITVLKVRYESTHYSYTSMIGAAKDIFAKEGLRGFFVGFGATAVRDAPYAGLYILIYEQSKAQLSAWNSYSPVAIPELAGTGGKVSAGSAISVNFISGVIAAISATTLTNPFDAIKTRLQIAPGRYPNMFIAAGMMLRNEGIRSMFSGLSMRIGRKALSSAFTWTVYEELIRRAEKVML